MMATMISVSINLALTAWNICCGLHFKRKGSDIWWIHIPVAVLCLCFAIFAAIIGGIAHD